VAKSQKRNVTTPMPIDVDLEWSLVLPSPSI
jgi:hypothetical protein